MKVKKILCCCCGGVGSSLIEKMNIESVLRKNGYGSIEVQNLSVSEINKRYADLFVIAAYLEKDMTDRGIKDYVMVKNIMNTKEIESVLIPKIKEIEER